LGKIKISHPQKHSSSYDYAMCMQVKSVPNDIILLQCCRTLNCKHHATDCRAKSSRSSNHCAFHEYNCRFNSCVCCNLCATKRIYKRAIIFKRKTIL